MPTTEAGKAISSRNALTLGLYTRQDYVKPEERELYKQFTETMHAELAPEGLLEQALAVEIAGATWRLRRCSNAEAEIADYSQTDPLLDETKEKTTRSLERARASAHSLLHRSVIQLRRLQTDRFCRVAVNAIGDDAGLSDYRNVTAASLNYEKLREIAASNREKGVPGPDLGSICNLPSTPAAIPSAPAGPAPQIARNAPCPCKSGEKYKRCCGKNAPPVLYTTGAAPGGPESKAA
jgi:hypothetical protein